MEAAGTQGRRAHQGPRRQGPALGLAPGENWLARVVLGLEALAGLGDRSGCRRLPPTVRVCFPRALAPLSGLGGGVRSAAESGS